MTSADSGLGDPISEVETLLSEFGISDEEISDEAIVPRAGSADDCTEAVFQVIEGRELLTHYPDRELQPILDEIREEHPSLFSSPINREHVREIQEHVSERSEHSLAGIRYPTFTGVLQFTNRSFNIDWKYSLETLTRQLSSILGTEGYSLECRNVDRSEWNGVTRNEHPETVRLALIDDASGDESSIHFRFPPSELGVNNFPAIAWAINEFLLDPIGLEILQFEKSGDSYEGVLISRENALELRNKYGPWIEIFGERLLEPQSLIEAAIDPVEPVGQVLYDREARIDHRDEYGFEEPVDVVKVESSPVGRSIIDARTGSQTSEEQSASGILSRFL